ncbi:hypothetical protein ABG79_02047 [Caloramator mitchellensis]|uniref:Uncharacterized protein n=1 Tax=Caloramator mitchellensis TaxID=908809 RepID=A0A0R3JYS0_CALMK|nr:hypothetical protein [Caloramator mitchellensis]KRQ86108.1 hypothetical protein ABG79_02047 [Caloramator mitchellensis]
MHYVKYEVKNNIPHFNCSFCGKCLGFLEATSYLTIKSRGCCWYFPKYKLIDIKNILDIGREDFIYEIYNLPYTKIEKYFIEILGFFDEEKYNKSKMNNNEFDSKLFFRLCPFFEKSGCKLYFALKPHPCNLYLCRGVIDACGEDYEKYNRERKDYFAYCNYYNDLMQKEFETRKISLMKDFDKSIEFLKMMQIPKFDFRKLEVLRFNIDLISIVSSDIVVAG